MPALALLSSVLVSGALTAISALHVHWAFGGAFPARTRAELGPLVVGTASSAGMPARTLTLAAAGVFLGAALLPLVAIGALPSPVPESWLGTFGAAMVGVFFLRGAYGYVDRRFRPETVGTPFESLNRRVYSPLCFGLGSLTALVFLSKGP